MQNHCSLGYRKDEREMFPMLKVRGMVLENGLVIVLNVPGSTLAWGPFHGLRLVVVFWPDHAKNKPSSVQPIGMILSIPALQSLSGKLDLRI
jgi:hypothetical protein